MREKERGNRAISAKYNVLQCKGEKVSPLPPFSAPLCSASQFWIQHNDSINGSNTAELRSAKTPLKLPLFSRNFPIYSTLR